MLHERIAHSGGWISFADYMETVLYTPETGYYSGGAAKFGTAGDFVTAPEISSLFGQALARQIAPILSAVDQGSILEFGGELDDAYRRIELEGGTRAEIEAKKAAYEAVVRAKQRAIGAVPGGGLGDDLPARVSTGIARIRETQDKDATGIVTESRRRQADYYSGTSEASTKVWTNAATDVSDDARKVIDDVAGVNRGAPRPVIAPQIPGAVTRRGNRKESDK